MDWWSYCRRDDFKKMLHHHHLPLTSFILIGFVILNTEENNITKSRILTQGLALYRPRDNELLLSANCIDFILMDTHIKKFFIVFTVKQFNFPSKMIKTKTENDKNNK